MKQVCTKCIYDEDVPDIVFDENGVCNYCKLYEEMNLEYPVGEAGDKMLADMVARIRQSGQGKKYDCVIGVSGGCDSSYLLYKMKEMGLRPLAVHFDNTWNSAIATQNIHKVTKKLGIDLYTHVVDNREYDDIYRSFLKAGVPDIEAPTDIGLITTLYQAAAKHGVKYIIEGHSFRTEGVSPLKWLYMDGKYIAGIQKKFGTYPIKTFPNLWLHLFLKWSLIDQIKRFRPLYFMNYQKDEVKKFLQAEFDWEWYGGHHLENRFTAFYHSYFMPKRFGIDCRLNGHAALVRSGQWDREAAMASMAEAPHLEEGILELVKKRLALSDAEFEMLMTAPKKTFQDYPTYKKTFERLGPLFWLAYKLDLVPKSFYIKFAKKQPTK